MSTACVPRRAWPTRLIWRLGRFRLAVALAVVAILALAISPWAADQRSAALRRSRELHARSLATTILEQQEWGGLWRKIEAFDGERATYVYFQFLGGRPPTPHTLIVPHDSEEPALLLLNETGPKSRDCSRLIIDQEDLRILEYVKAE